MPQPGVKRKFSWTWMMRILGLIGVADSFYLTLNALFPSIGLSCPTKGIINCALVTSSGYGEIHGFPIALGAMVWFALFIVLSFIKADYVPYLMLPLWLVGMVTIGYLISIELFVVRAICLYCTLAHICAALLGIPVVKLALSDVD